MKQAKTLCMQYNHFEKLIGKLRQELSILRLLKLRSRSLIHHENASVLVPDNALRIKNTEKLIIKIIDYITPYKNKFIIPSLKVSYDELITYKKKIIVFA